MINIHKTVTLVALAVIFSFLVVGSGYTQTLSEHADSRNWLGHYQCFKMKDEFKVKGSVSTLTPQFGAFAGCKLKKARFFCVPANKTSVSAKNKKESITPIPMGGNNSAFDQVCYKVSCPSGSGPADQVVADQMGVRTISKLKPQMVCMPAVKECEDSTKTNFVGGAGTQACHSVTTEEECNISWGVGDDGIPNSCFWEGGTCKGGPGNAGPFAVSNTCVDECAADTLTKVDSCRNFNGDETGCNGSWTIGGFGAASCFYDSGTNQCRGCGPANEFNERCTNQC